MFHAKRPVPSPPSGTRHDNVTMTHTMQDTDHLSSEQLAHSDRRRRESDNLKAPRWSTVQQPSHHHPHRPPDYLDGEAPRISTSSFKDQPGSMPNDTSPRGFHFPTQPAPPSQHPSKQHPSRQQHAGDGLHAAAVPRERSQGPPRLNNLHSSHPGPRDEESTGAGSQQGEPSSQSNSATSAHSPNRRRTRVLMTRVQSEALNKLWGVTMFPSTSEREALAQQIGLTARQVQVWFQNQRQKRRREKESDDAVQHHELSPNSQMHPTGWMTMHGPGHMAHQPPSHLGLVAHPYHPQPQPYGTHHAPRPSTMRSAAHPPVRPAVVYRPGPSPSHTLQSRQIMGHGASEQVGSSRSWDLRSPHDEHPPSLLMGSSRYSAHDNESPPAPDGPTSRDSYFGPQRQTRVRSTSHPNIRPYQPGVALPSSSRIPPSEPSSAYTRVSRTISPSSKSCDPDHGRREYKGGRYSPMDEMDEDQDLYLRGSRSAPARSSDLPPSLSSIVIDSPYESGAGPEAATLQPLNLREAEAHPKDVSMSPPSWRSKDKPGTRPELPRNPSGESEDGQSGRKTVADLLN